MIFIQFFLFQKQHVNINLVLVFFHQISLYFIQSFLNLLEEVPDIDYVKISKKKKERECN